MKRLILFTLFISLLALVAYTYAIEWLITLILR